MRKLTHPPIATNGRRRAFVFEQLEPRLALDAEGTTIGTDVHLTLSFAADGTSIAGQTNALASLFDAIAPRDVWQDKILTAFQTWAVHTNADIGVVGDGGQAFGSGGAIQGDSRFGDIRIGAIAMASNVAAVSVPTDGLVSGTWFADVLFNTAYNYQTIDDILAIAIHEAGNVFGLKDSDDPNSPLHPGDPPVVRQPTATDIALLQQLHGVRAPDLNEVSREHGNVTTNNDTITSASELLTVELNNSGHGSAPTIVYGDIGTNTDLDFFYLEPPSNYDGSLTIEVRTLGISLFKPRLRILDHNFQLVSQGVSTEFGGDRLIVNLPAIEEDQRLYFQVSSSDGDELNIGSYSLITIFDDRNLVSPAQIDEVAGGAFRSLPAEELAKFFDSEEDFFNDDDHTDDDVGDALQLETTPGFVEDTRYQVIGSITDATDADTYELSAPELDELLLDVMTVAVRSLDNGGLIPRVTVLDENANVVPSIILANGSGDYIVQVDGITPENNYLIKVEASHPGQLFDTGNYSLIVTFGTDVVPFDSLGLDPLPSIGNGITQNTHTLYVGKPQLFHFVMETENVAVTTPTALVATIYDDQGQAVYQISSRPGETRSREAVLLSSGTYTMRVVVLTLDGSVAPEIHYNVRWTAISDPFVGDPNDPTANPFACDEPGMEGFFCYPGEIVSPDPTLWDSFVAANSVPPDVNPSDTMSSLFGDWWSWVWAEFGGNGPVFANNDHYHTPTDAPLQAIGNLQSNLLGALNVGQVEGLLSNDVDPEGQEFLAVLDTNVSHGTLTLRPDGGFTYAPDPGFAGVDQFTYTAYDFVNQSNTGVVKIIVGDSGDFSMDGVVNGRDFLAWQRGFGLSAPVTRADGDGNYDSAVDALDLLIWQDQYPDSTTSPPSNGDADADGDVDGRDFLAWQRGFGQTAGALPADGDANGDQAVDALDLEIWQANYGSTFTLAAATVSSGPSLELQAAQSLASQDLPLVAEPAGEEIASLLSNDGTFGSLQFLQAVDQQLKLATEPGAGTTVPLSSESLPSPADRLERSQNASDRRLAIIDLAARRVGREISSDLKDRALAWEQIADEIVQSVGDTMRFKLDSPRVRRRTGR